MSKLEIGSCSNVGYGRNRDKTWYPDRFWKYKLEQEGEHLFEIGHAVDWEFEKDFLNKNTSSRVEAYDHTVDRHFWLNRFKKDFIAFLLLKKITPRQILDIFKYVSYLNFFKGKNKHHIKKIVSHKNDENNQATIS